MEVVKSKSSGVKRRTACLDAEEEEEADDPSSSSPQQQQNVEELLDNFRKEWHKELHYVPRQNRPEDTRFREKHDENSQDDEDNAMRLFQKGVEMEKSGKLYEAIQFYRRAVQLVPDIEFKLHDASKDSKAKQKESPVAVEKNEFKENIQEDTYAKSSEDESDDDDDEIKDDLITHIHKKLSRSNTFCTPHAEQKITHISKLPIELLFLIFRWVVSSDLDMRSLEMCSLVCRGFYLCARDSEIWRLACVRAWGVNCGNLPNVYTSWRQMFLERARLHFNGCYISKTTYIRHGENSFQDQFYRPWHLVAYYRYLRFFPEGVVLMLTTPEEPAHCVGQLKNRNVRSPSILTGHYRLKDDRVTIILQRQEVRNNNPVYKRNRKRDNMHESSEQTFHMELQIQNHNRKKHVQLVWTHYVVYTRTRRGEESSCSFDLVTSRFPPLWFSRVKSYTSEAESPLQ